MPLAGVHPNMTQCQSEISVNQGLALNATLSHVIETLIPPAYSFLLKIRNRYPIAGKISAHPARSA